MKRFLKYLMLLFLILTYACGGKSEGREKVQRQKNQPQNTEEVSRDTLQDKIHFAKDSLSASKIWTYQYTDSVFPCGPYRGCVIKGFWADGKGRFYIVGGIPLRLACYQGNKQEYSRVISNAICNSCMLRMRGDSLWFVEDSEHTILQIHKSGQGEIVRHAIPLAKEDSIMFGTLDENSYVLSIIDRAGAANATTYEENNSWKRSSKFAYPTMLLRTVDYSKLWSMYHQSKEWDIRYTPYGYEGNIGEWAVYLCSREYQDAFVALQRKGKSEVYIYPIRGLPPVAAVGVTDDMVGWSHSGHLDQLINGTLYLSGYGPDNGLFEIHVFDIAALCRRLERSK